MAAKEVTDEDELMFVTRKGVINRQHASEIRVIGRNTQGVRLVSLDKGDELMDVARVTAEFEIAADEAAAAEAEADAEDGAEVVVDEIAAGEEAVIDEIAAEQEAVIDESTADEDAGE